MSIMEFDSGIVDLNAAGLHAATDLYRRVLADLIQKDGLDTMLSQHYSAGET